MGVSLNTNVSSLRARYALSQSTSLYEKALTRLSTGLKINTPDDDVVGMAKSESLLTTIRGMEQSRMNISNVTGVLGVAEGYLSQLTEIAQEMRIVAVQAADPGLSSSLRDTLSDQFENLKDEYDRLTDNADYCGVNIFGNGAFGTGLTATVQVGPDSADTLDITIDDVRLEAIGRVAIYTAQTRTAVSTSAVASVSFAGPNGGLMVNGVAVPANAFTDDGVSSVEGSESAIAYVTAINSVTQTSGVRATVIANVFTIDYAAGNTLEANQHLVINGVTVKSTTDVLGLSDDDNASVLVSMINTYAAETGLDASLDVTNDEILLRASDGRNIHIQVSERGTLSGSYNIFGITGGADNTQMAQRGTFRLEADEAFDIENADNEFTTAAVESVAMDEYGDDPAGTTTLSEAVVTSVEDAGYAMTILSNVLNQLQNNRAEVGSILSRFESVENELVSRIENMQEAQSVIRDADLAVETANLTQFQILQQAGVTVLSQANASPQMVLELLKKM